MAHIKSFHLPYIEALRADGHEVLVMAKGKDADFDIGFVKKMLSSKNTECRRKIRKILRRERFDVIILNTTLAAFHIRLCLPKIKRPKVINLVHGYMFPKTVKTTRDRIFIFWEKFLRRKTDHIMVMNGEDYEIATKNKLCLGEVRMTLGMDASVSETVLPPETIRKYTESEGKFVLCFVGELYKAKNQRMLICALPEIQISIPNAVLWLVGEGVDRLELIELADELKISNSVCFVGRRNNPCDYMRACDVYVSASEKEGLPFNIMESLGCGKITLASDIKGHRDLIEDGKSGILYSLGDITDFVSKVKAIHGGDIKIAPEDAISRYEIYSKANAFPSTYKIMKELIEK